MEIKVTVEDRETKIDIVLDAKSIYDVVNNILPGLDKSEKDNKGKQYTYNKYKFPNNIKCNCKKEKDGEYILKCIFNGKEENEVFSSFENAQVAMINDFILYHSTNFSEQELHDIKRMCMDRNVKLEDCELCEDKAWTIIDGVCTWEIIKK